MATDPHQIALAQRCAEKAYENIKGLYPHCVPNLLMSGILFALKDDAALRADRTPAPAQPLAEACRQLSALPRYKTGGYGAVVECETGKWVRVDDVERILSADDLPRPRPSAAPTQPDAALPAIGSDLLCPHCAKQFCPHGEPMHFDKDGCPACDVPTAAQPDAAATLRAVLALLDTWPIEQANYPALVEARALLDAKAGCVTPHQDVEALQLIALERRRQRDVEGWTPEHDDSHIDGEMIEAARGYLSAGFLAERGRRWNGSPPPTWPWNQSWWKPSDDPMRNLVKAGALVVAEIERLQRETKESQ